SAHTISVFRVSGRPRRSTLFPYTPLFRSSADKTGSNASRTIVLTQHDRSRRSEEHTSELQSLAYLVCRLLLEKIKATARLLRPHASDTRARARFLRRAPE